MTGVTEKIDSDGVKSIRGMPFVVAPILLLSGTNVIVRVRRGYQVLSRKGKNLGGPYKTLEEAQKRLRKVEFFKRVKV